MRLIFDVVFNEVRLQVGVGTRASSPGEQHQKHSQSAQAASTQRII